MAGENEQSVEMGGPTSDVTSRATLLIVDDQPLYAEYMASVAEEHGWNVVAALTTGEFQSRFNFARPRAVALDLDMPGQDGIELLRFLADRDYAGSVMIISACDEAVVETSARLGMEMGLNVIGYAQKPVTEQKFTELLRRTSI